MNHVITGSDSNWTLFVFGCMFTLIAFRVIYYTYGLIRFSPEVLFNHRRQDLLKVFVITLELFDLLKLCSNWLMLSRVVLKEVYLLLVVVGAGGGGLVPSTVDDGAAARTSNLDPRYLWQLTHKEQRLFSQHWITSLASLSEILILKILHVKGNDRWIYLFLNYKSTASASGLFLFQMHLEDREWAH